MKVGNRKRLTAVILCMVLVLSNTDFIGAAISENEMQNTVISDNDIDKKDETKISENEVPLAPIVEETEPPKTVSENVISENSVSESNISENGVKADVEKILFQTIKGVTITLSASANVIPEDASLSVNELEAEALENVEEALENEEIKQKKRIQSYKAYDIKIIVSGNEVQPSGNVKVTFSGELPVIKEGKELLVYHIDEEKKVATDMKGKIENNEIREKPVVAIMTTHFSTYAIVQESTSSLLSKSNRQDMSNTVGQKKTVHVQSWDDRTYKIDLAAWAGNDVTKPVDVVMALDFSGSMPWMIDRPTGETITYLELINRTTNAVKQEHSIINSNPDQYQWKYKYYVEVTKSTFDGYTEYRPITWHDNKWQFVNPGNNYINLSSGCYDNNELKIYIRGENDKTKLDLLRECVGAFVKEMSQLEGCQISFTAFASGVQGNNIVNQSTDATNLIENGINTPFGTLKVDSEGNPVFSGGTTTALAGGTRQDIGLQQANDLIDRFSGDNNKVVILFTDGAPNGADLKDITDEMDNIIDKEVDLYTSIFYNDATKNKKIINYPDITVGDVVASWKEHVTALYESKNNASLIEAFDDMLDKIINSVTANRIIDQISNEFIYYLYDDTTKTGRPILYDENQDGIEDDYSSIPSGEKVLVFDIEGNGKLYINGEGIYFLQWENITLTGGAENTASFKKEFYVQAKNDYFGGNDVYTNGTNSGIYLNQEDSVPSIMFDRPPVNVKIEYELGMAEDIIFLGEELIDYFTVEKENIIKAVSVNGISIDEFCTKDITLECKWYKDALYSEETSFEEIQKSKPMETTVYYAKVIIKPKGNGVSSWESMTDDSGNMEYSNGMKYYAITPEGEERTEIGTYTIYVVDGKLDITKRINEYYEKKSVSEHIVDNQTFIFKIEKYNMGNDNQLIKDTDFGDVYETINFAQKEDIKTKTKTLIGLEKGYYKITEETDWSWKFEQRLKKFEGETVSVNEEEYFIVGKRSSMNGKSMFTGLDTETRKYMQAGRFFKLTEEGKALVETGDETTNPNLSIKFYNEKKEKKWFGDVSIMKNIFNKSE